MISSIVQSSNSYTRSKISTTDLSNKFEALRPLAERITTATFQIPWLGDIVTWVWSTKGKHRNKAGHVKASVKASADKTHGKGTNIQTPFRRIAMIGCIVHYRRKMNWIHIATTTAKESLNKKTNWINKRNINGKKWRRTFHSLTCIANRRQSELCWICCWIILRYAPDSLPGKKSTIWNISVENSTQSTLKSCHL
jgi:hypothetical protein